MMRCTGVVFLCGYLLIASTQAKAGFAMQYQFHDKQLPDITVPQPSAQVVSPSVYMQLGAQEKALQNNEARFAAIDQKFKDVDNSLEKFRSQIKPLEETGVQTHLIVKVGSFIIGLLLSSGLITFLGTYFKEYLPVKKRQHSSASSNVQAGVITSVYAASNTTPRSKDDTGLAKDQ